MRKAPTVLAIMIFVCIASVGFYRATTALDRTWQHNQINGADQYIITSGSAIDCTMYIWRDSLQLSARFDVKDPYTNAHIDTAGVLRLSAGTRVLRDDESITEMIKPVYENCNRKLKYLSEAVKRDVRRFGYMPDDPKK